jgi:hypothetical protein
MPWRRLSRIVGKLRAPIVPIGETKQVVERPAYIPIPAKAPAAALRHFHELALRPGAHAGGDDLATFSLLPRPADVRSFL